MPSDNYADIFLESESLAKLPPDVQNKAIDKVTALAQNSEMTDGDKRYYRNLSANTKLELYKARGGHDPSQNTATMRYPGSQAFVGDSGYSAADYAKETFGNTARGLKDVGTAIVGGVQRVPAMAMKVGVDIADIAMHMPSFFSLDGNKYYREDLDEYLTDADYKQKRFVEPYKVAVTEPYYAWYDNLDTVKNDPAMARMVDAAATDAAIGTAFGAYKVMKGGAELAMGAKAAQIGSSAFANAAGGQLVLTGLDAIEPEIESSNFTESQKNGLRVLSTLALAFFSAAGVETKIERFIDKAAASPKLLDSVGTAVKAAQETGATDATNIVSSILKNQDISAETKAYLKEVAQESGIKAVDDAAPEVAQATASDPMWRDAFRAPRETPSAPKIDLADDAAVDLALTEAVQKVGTADSAFQKTALGQPLAPEEQALLSTEAWAKPVVQKRVRPTLTAEEARQAATGQMPFSTTATVDRALATAEEIVGKARQLQKTNPEALQEFMAVEKERLYDAQRAIFNVYGDKKSYLSHISSQVRKDKKELKKIVSAGRKAPGAEKDELRNLYRAKKQNIDNLDRLKGFVSKEFRTDLTAKRPIVEAATDTSLGTPLAKTAEKVDAKSVASEITKLSPEKQLKVQRVTTSIASVMEAQGLKVTEEMKWGITDDVMKKMAVEVRQIAERPLVQTLGGMPVIDREVLGQRFPAVKMISDSLPESMAATMQPQELMQVMQSLVARSGLDLDDAAYALQRDAMRETFTVWDEVRASIPKNIPDSPLSKFLETNNSLYGMSKKKAAEFTNRLREVFPDMDYVSVRGDRNLPSNIGGTLDTLQRSVTIGVSKDDFSSLLHELGHYNFYYGLDAADKIAWLDGMRKYASDTDAWAKNFPGYDKRLAGLEFLTNRDEIATQVYWMHHPGEMYAEQFRAYMIDSVLPPLNSGGAITKAKQAIQKLFDIDASEFSKLPQDTQEQMLRTKMLPDPSEMETISQDLVDRAINESWHYSDAPSAEMRVAEINRNLDELYSGRNVDINVLEEGGAVGLDAAVPFSQLPAVKRVEMYSLLDLPSVVEAQSLKLLHDLPGFDMEELQLAMRKLDNSLSDEVRSELIEKMVTARTKRAGTYDPNFDPASGQYYTSAEKSSMRTEGVVQDYNSAPAHLRRAIDAGESAYGRVFYATRRTIYEDELEQLENILGRPLDVNEQHRLRLRVNDGEFDISPELLMTERSAAPIDDYLTIAPKALATRPKVIQARNQLIEMTEGWNAQRSAVFQQLAALDMEAASLREFANNVLTKKGFIETINPGFARKIDATESFLRAAKNEDKLVDYFTKGAWRIVFTGVVGMDQDDEGIFWNPEKVLSRGVFMPLVIPGGPALLRLGARQAIKGSTALARKLPVGFTTAVRNTVRGIVHNFGPTEGLGEELIGVRQAAQHKTLAKVGELKAMADTIFSNFTEKQRAQIGRIVSGDVGWEKALERAMLKDPALAVTAKVTQKMYTDIADEMSRLGMIDPNKALLESRYANRVYTNVMGGAAGQSTIFWKPGNIKGIAGYYFKRRGVAEVLSDSVRKTSKNTWTGPLGYTELVKQLEAEGFPASSWSQGMRFNSYLAEDGTRLFAKTDTLYDKTLASQLKPEHVWSESGQRGYVLDSYKNRSMKFRRDFTKSERTAMGECTDIAVRMAAFSEKIKNDLTQGLLFKRLSETDWSFNPEMAKHTKVPGFAEMVPVDQAINHAELNGWTKLPYKVNEETGVLQYGALSGSYVHPDAIAMIKAMQPSQISKIMQNPEMFNSVAATALGTYSKLLSLFKISKTALSPSTHVANFISNPFMGYMLGRSPSSDLYNGWRLMKVRGLELKANNLAKKAKTAEDYARITELRKQMQNADPEAFDYYTKIRKFGIGDSAMLASDVNYQDMISSMETFAKNRGKPIEGLSQQELMKWNMATMLSASHEKAMSAARKVTGLAAAGTKKMGQYYEAGDLVFKMGGIMADMKKGVPIEKAVSSVYEAYFDYSQLAPGIRFMRDSGVVPFISYTYKAVPALAKAAYKNPHRVAQIGLMYEAIHLMGMADMYGSENMFAASDALEEFEPDQISGRQFGGLIRTNFAVPGGGGPKLTKDGKTVDTVRFMNTTRQFPGGDIFGTGLSLSGLSGRGVASTVGKLFLNNPFVSAAMDIASGRNIALDIPMYRGGDIDAPEVESRKDQMALDRIINTFTPNMPGNPWAKTHQDLMMTLVSMGLMDSYAGKTGYDQKGLRTPWSVATANMMGFRTRDVVPQMDAGTKMKYDQSQLNAEKTYLKRILRDQSATDEKKEEALLSYERTAQFVADRQSRRAELLRRLNQARQARIGGRALVQ